jgi:hypothetical protein
VSHYLRAALIVSLCSTYAVDPTLGCNANFRSTRAIRSAAAANAKPDPHLAETRAVLRGAPRRARRGRELAEPRRRAAPEDPGTRARREAALERLRRRAERPSPSLEGGSPDEPLLDYLLGDAR